MAFNPETIIKGKQHKAPRIIVLGEAKVGKSTFACAGASPFVVQINGEEGVDEFDVDKSPPCMLWEDVVDVLTWVLNGDHKHKTLIIDSASMLQTLIFDSVCKRYPSKGNTIETVLDGYQRGYKVSLDWWDTLTNILDEIRKKRNMVSILTGHVITKNYKNPLGPDYDEFAWDIYKDASEKLIRWADSVLFLSKKVFVQKQKGGFGTERNKAIDIGDGKTYCYTQPKPSHPGGGRGPYGRLPYEIEIGYDSTGNYTGWNSYMNAVAEATQKQ